MGMASLWAKAQVHTSMHAIEAPGMCSDRDGGGGMGVGVCGGQGKVSSRSSVFPYPCNLYAILVQSRQDESCFFLGFSTQPSTTSRTNYNSAQNDQRRGSGDSNRGR